MNIGINLVNNIYNNLAFLSNNLPDPDRIDGNWVKGELGGGGSAVANIENFNSMLLDLLLYAGAIIIAIGVMKLIISIQQQDSSSKLQASMLFALGITFTATNAIVNYLNIKDTIGQNNGTQIVVKRLTTVMAKGLQVTAIILLVFGFSQLIMSFVNQDSNQKAEASKLLGVSVAFWSSKTILNNIVEAAMAPSGKGSVIKAVLSIVATIAQFTGAVILGFGLFHLVFALKDHDSSQYQSSIIATGAGAALLLFPLILRSIGLF